MKPLIINHHEPLSYTVTQIKSADFLLQTFHFSNAYIYYYLNSEQATHKIEQIQRC